MLSNPAAGIIKTVRILSCAKTKKGQEISDVEIKNRKEVDNFVSDNKEILFEDGKVKSEYQDYIGKYGKLYNIMYLRKPKEFDKYFVGLKKKVEEAKNNLTSEQKQEMEDNKKKNKAFNDLKDEYKNPTNEQQTIFDELEKQKGSLKLEEFNKKIGEAKKKLEELEKESGAKTKNLGRLNNLKSVYSIIIYENGKDGKIKQDYAQTLEDLANDECLKNQSEFDKKFTDLKNKLEEAKNNLGQEDLKKLKEREEKLKAFDSFKKGYTNQKSEHIKIFEALMGKIEDDNLTLEGFKKEIEKAKKEIDDISSENTNNGDINLEDIKKIEDGYKKLDTGKMGEYERTLGNVFDWLIKCTENEEEKKKLKEAKTNFKPQEITDNKREDFKNIMGSIVMLAKGLKLDIAQGDDENKDKNQEKIAKILGISKEELLKLANIKDHPENIFELVKKCSVAIKENRTKEIGFGIGSGVSGILALALVAVVAVGGFSVLPFAVPFFVPFIAAGVLGVSSAGLGIVAGVSGSKKTLINKEIQQPITKVLTEGGKNNKGILGQIPKLVDKKDEKIDDKLPG